MEVSFVFINFFSKNYFFSKITKCCLQRKPWEVHEIR